MKRSFDIIVSFCALLLLSPVILITAALVAFKLGVPVFFTQLRPGKEGHIFRMVKFRSMTNERDITGKLLPDDVRLTHFGKFLRSTSLDELPELWNVLKGDMSLVGPRPLLPEYLPLYSARQAKRHEVRPGITGWAQIHGRNAISWEQKFELDVWYVEHRSFWLDIKILLLTLKKVLVREGIHAEGSATVERFSGSNSQTSDK